MSKAEDCSPRRHSCVSAVASGVTEEPGCYWRHLGHKHCNEVKGDSAGSPVSAHYHLLLFTKPLPLLPSHMLNACRPTPIISPSTEALNLHIPDAYWHALTLQGLRSCYQASSCHGLRCTLRPRLCKLAEQPAPCSLYRVGACMDTILSQAGVETACCSVESLSDSK